MLVVPVRPSAAVALIATWSLSERVLRSVLRAFAETLTVSLDAPLAVPSFGAPRLASVAVERHAV